MKIEVDDKYYQFIADGIKLLIKNYDDCGYQLTDVPLMANVGIIFNEAAKKAIREIDDEEEKYNKEHPEFTRPPQQGEKFVMGKGYVNETRPGNK